MTSQSLTWNGDALTARMRRAQIVGVNATMGRAVVHAKENHDWQNQSGVLEGSIDIVEGAQVEGTGVVGTWGSKDVRYALIHELGGTIVPVNAKALAIPQADGGVVFAKSVKIPARPYLRPAADAVYPQLPGNIRKAFEKDGGGSGSTS